MNLFFSYLLLLQYILLVFHFSRHWLWNFFKWPMKPNEGIDFTSYFLPMHCCSCHLMFTITLELRKITTILSSVLKKMFPHKIRDILTYCTISGGNQLYYLILSDFELPLLWWNTITKITWGGRDLSGLLFHITVHH